MLHILSVVNTVEYMLAEGPMFNSQQHIQLKGSQLGRDVELSWKPLGRAAAK